MAFLAFLRALFVSDMAIDAEAVHGLITVIALVASGALLLALGVVFHMVAIDAFEPFVLVGLM
jgi:hypothetical protein